MIKWSHSSLHATKLLFKLNTKQTPVKKVMGLCPYWFPAKRDVTRSNKHSVEVVVEDEDSPVDEHDEINAASCSV